MKKILFVFFASAVFVAVPFIGVGSEIRYGENLSLTGMYAIEEDAYLAGGSVVVSRPASADVVAAGGSLTFQNSVQGDVMAAGGTISLFGKVIDDARLAGGTIVIGSEIGNDLAAAGGQVSILSDAVIGNDLLIAGGTINLDGFVGGKVRMVGERLFLNGTIKGDVSLSGREITIESNAVIEGNLMYRSPQEAVIAPGATIRGKTTYEPSDKLSGYGRWGAENFWKGALVAFALKFLAILASVLTVTLAFPKPIRSFGRGVFTAFGRNIGKGFLVLIATPVVGFMLLATIVGAPLGVFLFLSYGAAMTIACLVSPLIIGAWGMKLITKGESIEIDWKAAVLGVVIAMVAGLIPFLGWVLGFVVMLAVLGEMWGRVASWARG
jgi:cytoskeletal protein CcmA (bactofilin family)